MPTNINPRKNEVKNNNFIIFRFPKPLIFKTSNSFLLISSKKKNCVEIKKIKGKISNSVEGEFIKVIKIGKNIPTFSSLKKEISSKILKIKIKQKNISEIVNIFFTKSVTKYFS